MSNTARMTSLTQEHRVAARVRAAFAYCGLHPGEVAKRTAISEATLRRITSAARPRGASLDELWLLADACRVPREWLTDGVWTDVEHDDPTQPQPALAPYERVGRGTTKQRLETIERYLVALLRLEQNRSGELPLPRDEAARVPRQRRATQADGALPLRAGDSA